MPYEVEGDRPRNYWQFIFLFDTTRSEGQYEFNFHPFYSIYKNEERAYIAQQFLYPIFYAQGTNYWNSWSFLYFFSGKSLYHTDAGAGEDSDFLIGPIHGGYGTHKESYGGFFPIGGYFTDLFGYDRVTYALFPIYAGWSYKDYQAHGILWPLIMWGSGNKRKDLRIFPFYSSKVHYGKYNRKSLLWPFFQWGSEDLDKLEPHYYFTSWPLFGYKWSEYNNLMAWEILWLPYFGGFVSYGRDYTKEQVDLSILWSLIQYSKGRDPDIDKLVLFPFYGHYRYGQLYDDNKQPYKKEAQFITPFWTRLQTNSAFLDSDDKFLIPFYWDLHRYYHKEREEERTIAVWPFIKYKNSTDNSLEVSSLTLWPASDTFEKNWGPLVSIFQYKRYENDDQYLSLFFRLYSQYWNANGGHFFLAGLEVHNDDQHSSFEILGGLLGFHRYTLNDGNSQGAFDFLWIKMNHPSEDKLD